MVATFTYADSSRQKFHADHNVYFLNPERRKLLVHKYIDFEQKRRMYQLIDPLLCSSRSRAGL